MDGKKIEVPTKLPKEITDKYQVENNTLKQEVKSNPKDRIEVEIGDAKQTDFKPQVKLMRWDNEVNFSLRAIEHPDAVVEIEKEVVKYKTPDYEVHQYDKPEAGEDGGHEFEWYLPSKPKSNVLTATIQTKGLNFFFQPPLTQEEIDEGANRPENVIGSYAVYHKTKGGMNDEAGMEYKVGKAFHIYRPKVTDANGVETWGELNIDEAKGELTVTIDQAWLDNAAYPVVVDPTFGYTSLGSLSTTHGNFPDRLYIRVGTPGESGALDSISFGADKNSGSNISWQGGLYDDSLNLLSPQTSTGTISSSTKQFWTLTFTGGPNITGSNNYYAAAFVDSSVNTSGRYAYDSGGVSGDSKIQDSISYNTWPDPFSGFGTALIISIYATYTASGGGGGTDTDNFFHFFPLMKIILILALLGR